MSFSAKRMLSSSRAVEVLRTISSRTPFSNRSSRYVLSFSAPSDSTAAPALAATHFSWAPKNARTCFQSASLMVETSLASTRSITSVRRRSVAFS